MHDVRQQGLGELLQRSASALPSRQPYERREALFFSDRNQLPQVLCGLNPSQRVPTIIPRRPAESGSRKRHHLVLRDGNRDVPDDRYGSRAGPNVSSSGSKKRPRAERPVAALLAARSGLRLRPGGVSRSVIRSCLQGADAMIGTSPRTPGSPSGVLELSPTLAPTPTTPSPPSEASTREISSSTARLSTAWSPARPFTHYYS